MPGDYSFARGGSTVAGGGHASSVRFKPRKAKCTDNQPAVDRLEELANKYSNQQSNFIHTIRKAIKSVADCKGPITTQKQAMELKFVGPSLAKAIVPSSTAGTAAASSSVPASNTSSTSRENTINSNDIFKDAGERWGDGSSSSNYKAEQEDTKTAAAATESNQPDSRKRSCPGAILLTGRVTRVAPPPRKIKKTDNNNTAVDDSENASDLTPKQKAYNLAKQEAETTVFPPKGLWKLILVVDGREHKSKQVVSSCKQAGIPTEERHLPIGDMAWVAQCIIPKQKPIEIMVGTIIERKEISDLVSSLYGTRYSEQRLRLSQCGIPQVLFLVEGEITNVPNCPADTIRMAMMETRVQLGFQVVQTKHLVDTVRVLKGLHRRIVQRTFPNAFWSSQKDNVVICPSSSTQTNSSARKENCVPSFVRDHDAAGKHRNGRRRVSSLLEMVFDTAPIPPFGAQRFITYSELKAKVELDREQATRRIGAVTLAMLKQIPSLSEKKCTAIGVLYPTMNRLLEALCYEPYDEHDDTTSIPKKRAVTNPAKLIQTIPVGRNLTVGPKSGSEVYTALCTLADGALLLPNLPSMNGIDIEERKEKKGHTASAKPKIGGLKQRPPILSATPSVSLKSRNEPQKPPKTRQATAGEAPIHASISQRKTSDPALTPHRRAQQDDDVIDLMSPDEKLASKTNVFSSYNIADDSFFRSSPDSWDSSPDLSHFSLKKPQQQNMDLQANGKSIQSATQSTNKDSHVARLLMADDSSSVNSNNDDDFDIGRMATQKNISISEEDRDKSDLKTALCVGLEELSSKGKNFKSRQDTARIDSYTLNRKPANRKVSNDSMFDGHNAISGPPKADVGKKYLCSSSCDNSSKSSPGFFSLSSDEGNSTAGKEESGGGSLGDLRNRLADKLGREVIEIDSD